ncbi:cell division protein ZapA [Roseivirga pacifica]|uniref:Cell division protein ZapA n=1 Tax=Roseivirga pacifica TaxID=1267423 RepID=A0A1I0NQP3_9BACT|nr:cell division protein ZapA [Roseivirga pacifica]MCO6359907.1 cell division protein ZapA [Roseivirga pacifica]MCO6367277.1 cell division protein ZapA [Roseivirga pacifica]MCO6370191.1 cell division protein ZapA [Roseivirga pacifica]MCO6374934.1 cell division protein ZapA [Roseivirga pacifica]MCO6380192.1 cell division protein ZapA [Roseivirga pacifica]
MDLLSIKIKIADREYPMKVKPEEEARVRSAGKFINDRLKSYREKFGIDDKEDLLAMVAFDCMVAKLKSEEESTAIDSTAESQIDAINKMLNSALS